MNKKYKIGIIIGIVVAVLIAIIAAVAIHTNNKKKQEETKVETPKVEKKKETKSVDKEETFIATAELTVYEKADKESQVLGTTKEGEKVVVVNKDDKSFVKIKYKDGFGYIENSDNLMTEEEFNKKKEEETKVAEEAKAQEESNGNQSNRTNTATNDQTVVQNTDPVPQPTPNYVSQPQPAYGSYRWDNPNATAGEWFHAHYTVTYEFRDDGYWHTTHIQPSGGFPGDLFQTASDVVYNSVAATPGTPGQNVTKTLFIYAGGEQIIPAQ